MTLGLPVVVVDDFAGNTARSWLIGAGIVYANWTAKIEYGYIRPDFIVRYRCRQASGLSRQANDNLAAGRIANDRNGSISDLRCVRANVRCTLNTGH